jgi:hypothetical protein
MLDRVEGYGSGLANHPVHRTLQLRAHGIRHKPRTSTLRKNASYLGPTLLQNPLLQNPLLQKTISTQNNVAAGTQDTNS